jgi:L-iditol 2-dehydrogenase
LIGLCKTAPGVGNLELREFPRPDIGDGEVLIRVEATGICGSDLHILNWDTKVTMRPPVIIGHEFCGSIAETGRGVKGLKTGDRVTAEPTFQVCGQCIHCHSGFYNLCSERKVLGFAINGAFAEFVRVPSSRVHRLPDNVDFHTGAITEPLACCVHGLYELTGITADDFAVVSGPGTIGLLCLGLLKAAGARVILIGTEVDAERLKLGMNLGADQTLNLADQDAVQRVMELTDGNGADLVVECSGSAAAASLGLELVRKRGKYTQMGLFGKPINLDFERIAYKEIQVVGSFAQKWSAWNRALSLMDQKKVNLVPLVSDVLPLKDWQTGFEKLNSKLGLKVILTP